MSSEISEEIAKDVLDYISHPEETSFDVVYNKIFNAIENKVDLKPAISEIIDSLTPVASSSENDLESIYNKTDTFCKNIGILHNLFLYYESQLTNDKDPNKIINIANNQILTRYFFPETTRASLKSIVVSVISAFLNEQEPIPKEISRVAFYIFAIKSDLYDEIFNSSFTRQLSFFIEEKRINEREDKIDAIEAAYAMYDNISKGIRYTFPPVTYHLLKETLANSIIIPQAKIITNENFIKLAIEHGTETVRKLFILIKLGSPEYQQMFSTGFKEFLKNALEAIDKPDFKGLCSDIRNIYLEITEVDKNAFHGQLRNEIWSAFVRYLDEFRFIDKLCDYHNMCQEPVEEVADICVFLNSDTDFEERYSLYLTKRLLCGLSSIDDEQALADFYKEHGAAFESVQKKLDDFKSAIRTESSIDGIDVNIITLNTFNWKLLDSIEFRPLDFFDNLFHQVIDSTNVIQRIKESQGIENYSDLIVNLTDKFSTVEFSDGNSTFELTFFHANIVKLVMDFTEKGGISEDQIKEILKIYSLEDLKSSLNFLVNRNILKREGGIGCTTCGARYVFVGAPNTKTFNDDAPKIQRHPSEPVFFANINDQIEAAICRFLKPIKYAKTEDIKSFVFKQLSPQFNVTNDAIDECIKRLIDKEFITTHGEKGNCYKFVRT